MKKVTGGHKDFTVEIAALYRQPRLDSPCLALKACVGRPKT